MLARALGEVLAPRHEILAASHSEADITDVKRLRMRLKWPIRTRW